MTTKLSAIFVAMMLAGIGVTAPAFAEPSQTTAPRCTSETTSVRTSDQGGAFDGTRHGGTLVEVRNTSTSTCSFVPFPPIGFQNVRHAALPIAVVIDSPFTSPIVRGSRLPMGHGPVALPFELSPNGTTTTSLRWASVDAFERGACVHPAFLTIALAGRALTTPFHGTICGENTKPITITAKRFTQ